MQHFLTNFRWNLGTRVGKVLFSSTQSFFFGGGGPYTLLILELWHAFKPLGNLLLSNHWEVDRSQEPDYLASTSNGGGSQFTWGNTKSHTECFVWIHQGLNHIVTNSTWQFGLEVYRLDSRHQPNSSLIERPSHGNEGLLVDVSQRRLPPSFMPGFRAFSLLLFPLLVCFIRSAWFIHSLNTHLPSVLEVSDAWWNTQKNHWRESSPYRLTR